MRSLALCMLLFGCSTEPGVAEISEALATTPRALASFPDGFEMVGVSGDERVVFAGKIASVTQQPAVVAAARLSGNPIGALPPPPSGWGVPSAVTVLDYHTSGLGTSGTLLVTDNGALPPFSHVTLYRYSYAYSPAAGFTSSLLDVHPLPVQTFPPMAIDGVGYVGDVAVLPSGELVLADALDGAFWVCDASFVCRLGDADFDFSPAPAPPSFTGVGRAHGGGVRPYTLVIANGLMPGLLNAVYIDRTDEVCGSRAAPPGGIWCIARALLVDPVLPPFGKAKRVLVPPTVGLSDGLHGLAYDHWHEGSSSLYFVRSVADVVGGGSNIVRRVDVTTGAVSEVARSLMVMDFSTGLVVLPPLVAGSPLTNLAVAMGQEEWNGAINPATGGIDDFVSPTIIAAATAFAY